MGIADKVGATPKNIGLRSRMLTVLLIASVPGIIVAIFLTVQKFKEETDHIEATVARFATLGAVQHHSVIGNARILLKAVAATQQLNELAEADCRTYFEGWTNKLVYFGSLTLFDRNGSIVCTSVDGELSYSVEDKDWFLKAAEGENFALSDYTLGRRNTPILVAAVPVLDTSEEPIGVVALGISLKWLDFIAGNIELPEGGTITALGPEGQLLSHQGATSEVAPLPSQNALERMQAQGSGTLRATDVLGTTRVYGFEETDLGGVLVVVGLPQFIEYSRWGNALLNTLLSPMFVLALAIIAAAWASEALVVRHVRSLISTADAIASGDFRARSEVDYDEHELGELAAAIDSMAEAIEDSRDELEQRVEGSEMVSREMAHRLSNLMTLVQAISHQTIRHAESSEEFKEAFNARLHALAGANRLLAERGWKCANLSQIVELILAPYGVGDEQRFRCDGPDIMLESAAVTAISMTVNELATNAVKYGSLSQHGGTIDLTWRRREENGRPWLEFEWRESGGLPPAQPNGKGFGAKMIRAMIEGRLGGRIEKEFGQAGLVCRISIPLNEPSGHHPKKPPDLAIVGGNGASD